MKVNFTKGFKVKWCLLFHQGHIKEWGRINPRHFKCFKCNRFLFLIAKQREVENDHE